MSCKDGNSWKDGRFSGQSEQEKIVGILDSIDTQIAGDKMRMGKLRHKKADLMHDILIGKVRVKNWN